MFKKWKEEWCEKNSKKIAQEFIEKNSAIKNLLLETFALGFKEGQSKAWDSMMPYMKDSIDQIKVRLREDAIDETLKRLSSGNNKKIN